MSLEKEIDYNNQTNDLLPETPLVLKSLSIPNPSHCNNTSIKSIRTHYFISPTDNSCVVESFSVGLPRKSSKVFQGRNSLPQNSQSSNTLSNQPRNQLRERFYRKNHAFQDNLSSPLALERESSSSQTSKLLSEFFDSPQALQRVNSWETMFNQNYYQRIDKFLDSEGLDLVDMGEEIRGIRCFTMRKLSRKEACQSEGKDEKVDQKFAHSANYSHSPKLINSHIISSALYQRRASRSQGHDLITLEKIDIQNKPKKIEIFKNLYEGASTIEEMITPLRSKENSTLKEEVEIPMIVFNKFNSKQYKSPQKEFIQVEEPRGRDKSLHHSRSLRSPNVEATPSSALFIDSSFKVSKTIKTKTAISLHTSPTTYNEQNPFKRFKQMFNPSNLNKKIPGRKSYFKKFSTFES